MAELILSASRFYSLTSPYSLGEGVNDTREVSVTPIKNKDIKCLLKDFTEKRVFLKNNLLCTSCMINSAVLFFTMKSFSLELLNKTRCSVMGATPEAHVLSTSALHVPPAFPTGHIPAAPTPAAPPDRTLELLRHLPSVAMAQCAVTSDAQGAVQLN